MINKDIIKQTIDYAKKMSKGGKFGPFAASVFKYDQSISAWTECNCVVAYKDPTAHAEILAIRKACHDLETYDLSGYSIYSTCFPCPMCLSAIIWARIKNVYFSSIGSDASNAGFDDETIMFRLVRIKDLNIEKQIKKSFVEMNFEKCLDYSQEALEVLENWTKNKNKKPY